MCHGIPVKCNSKLPRCCTKTAIMAEQLILGMWPTISLLLSPKQHSMIRVVRIPPHRHEEKAAHQGREFKYTVLVHVVAMYAIFPAVLSFLCRHVLRLTGVDTFPAYNGMVRVYREPRYYSTFILVIKHNFLP